MALTRATSILRELDDNLWSVSALVGGPGLQASCLYNKRRESYALAKDMKSPPPRGALKRLSDNPSNASICHSERSEESHGFRHLHLGDSSADASWAIRFYEKHGFRVVTVEEKNRLLKKYWSIPDRQIETSVVLAEENWSDEP